MNCPHCGAAERAQVRVCQACGTTYASQDLLELRQLEFLLAETAGWPGASGRQQPYLLRLAALRERIVPKAAPDAEAAAPQAAVAEAAEPQTAAAPQAVTAEVPQATVAPPPPRPEPIPFDQWLLSERNIKIALYSGGLLLVLAGLIFVGVNWVRIPGPAKFAITLVVTGLMYLGAYLLFRRPGLRLGGLALLGVASGFVPLNFVVLQIYIFSAQGVSGSQMWLIASAAALPLYLLTAYWTRADLFTYLSVAAGVSLITAALVLANAPVLAFGLAYAWMALALLLAARALQSTPLAGFTRDPLLALAHVAAPLLFLYNAASWVTVAGCLGCIQGSPWLALAGLLAGVVFYAASDLAFGVLEARWAAVFAFALAFVFLLVELGISSTASGIVLMALALAYLLGGAGVEYRSQKRAGALPLYAAGYAVAAFVTLRAGLDVGQDPGDLALALLGDAALFALSARLHRQFAWVYGAVWVFVVPVFIYAGLYLGGLTNQGLALGALMLSYAAAGYALGRRALRWGGPFLSAAAFLSLVVPMLTWGQPAVASVALGVIAALYLLWALRLGEAWSWLLLPALAAVNAAVVAVLRIFLQAASPGAEALSVAYAALGVALALGGAGLRRAGQARWAWPMYVFAALNLGGAYVVALFVGGGLAVGLSAAVGLLAFGLAWVERAAFRARGLPPQLVYLGLGSVFIGFLYLIGLSPSLVQAWPASTAGLCALFVALAWPLRRGELAEIYGLPLRHAGLGLMLVPLIGVAAILDPLVAAAAYAIAGAAYAMDAIIRRVLLLAYLAVGAFLVALWAGLLFFEVGAIQAYVVPLGLTLLALGANERRLGRRDWYVLPTLAGLLVMTGSAFAQSFDSALYAGLLLAECSIAIVVGVRAHSRSYFQVGLFGLIANGIAQFGPAFVELPRWIQLGLIGVILLGGGLLALFRREQILATRQAIVTGWKTWTP